MNKFNNKIIEELKHIDKHLDRLISNNEYSLINLNILDHIHILNNAIESKKANTFKYITINDETSIMLNVFQFIKNYNNVQDINILGKLHDTIFIKHNNQNVELIFDTNIKELEQIYKILCHYNNINEQLFLYDISILYANIVNFINQYFK